MTPDPYQTLKRYFGFDTFRAYQREIIDAVVSGRDVFAALPTGGGKSLCYQLPALLLPQLTVVVSPLIALMKDQVDGAVENGVPAAYLNSSLDRDTARETWYRVKTGEVKLLYVSPERLARAEFRAALGGVGLSLVAVDEAHCISEWGHEFRPDYRSLHVFRSELPSVPIAAFTATATREVQEDVIRQLRFKDPLVVRASFDRKEIFYRVSAKRSVNRQIWDFIADHPGEAGIVYRNTRKSADETAEFLRGQGVSVASYHAGLSDDERRSRQEQFVRDETTVVVATIAFGMGIDKSNIRWIVHGDLPRSIEGYYQETGRAARDGEPATAVMFFGPGDIAKVRYHIERAESEVERDRAELQLREILRYVDSSSCRRKQLLAHFDEIHPGNCGGCDVCSGEVELADETVNAQKILSAAVRTGQRFGAHHLIDVVRGESSDKVLARNHQSLPTFGVGSDRSRQFWLALVRDLEAGEYLMRTGGRIGGYQVTGKGRLLLKGKETFLARRREVAAGGSRSDAGAGSRGFDQPVAGTPAATVTGGARYGDLFAGSLDPEEAGRLFQCLKQVRMALARQKGVPPYVVFSDKSLRAMVELLPADTESFLACHGVGQRKLEQYGDTFMSAIRTFRSSGDCAFDAV